MTWAWTNTDRNVISEWTIPLKGGSARVCLLGNYGGHHSAWVCDDKYQQILLFYYYWLQLFYQCLMSVSIYIKKKRIWYFRLFAHQFSFWNCTTVNGHGLFALSIIRKSYRKPMSPRLIVMHRNLCEQRIDPQCVFLVLLHGHLVICAPLLLKMTPRVSETAFHVFHRGTNSHPSHNLCFYYCDLENAQISMWYWYLTITMNM